MKEHETIEQFIRKRMLETRIPGLAISYRGQNGESKEEAFGFSDLNLGSPVTAKTCFALGSLTKAFTSISILKLREAGKLELDRSVSHYIEQLEGTCFEKVNIHHLLTHTSGIATLGSAERSLLRQMSPGSEAQERQTGEADSFYETLRHAGEWTIAPPGSEFCYLNEGYTLLHNIVEEVSGLSYEEYVEKNIFEPLGMRDTFFLGRVDRSRHEIATPYSTVSSSIPVPVEPVGGTPGSGSIYSNVVDMGKFIEMLINRGTLKGTTILEAEDVERMEELHAEVHSTEIGPNGPKISGNLGYGYALNVDRDFFGKKLLSHYGSVFVYTSYMGYVPELGTFTVIMCNTTGYPLGVIGKFALSMLTGNDPSDLTFLRNNEITGGLCGQYESYLGTISVEVSHEDNFLRLKPNYSSTSVLLIPELISEDKAVFYALQGSIRVYAYFTVRERKGIEVNYSSQRLKRRE